MSWRYCWQKAALVASCSTASVVFLTIANIDSTKQQQQNHHNNSKRIIKSIDRPFFISPPSWVLSRATLAENQGEENNSKKNIASFSFSSVDDLIGRVFNTTNDISTIKVPNRKDFEETVVKLYPRLASQLDSMREGYVKFWDFLTMDEFRHMVEMAEKEIKDVKHHPEVGMDAIVRYGSGMLCDQELAFIKARKMKQKEAFAKFIGVSVNEIEVQDIPVVGIAAR